MLTEDLHLLFFAVRHDQNGIVAVGSVRMNLIAISRNSGIFSYFSRFRVVAVVNQTAAFFYCIYKNSELLKITIKCRENIDVVPPYSADYCDMRMIFMELRHSVDRRSKIFVALDDHIFSGLAEANHHVETFELGSNHEIGLDAGLFHHMQNH